MEYIFDMDNTLTESCQKIDSEMIMLLNLLSRNNKISIATGGTFKHVIHQVLSHTDFSAKIISVSGSRVDLYAPNELIQNVWSDTLSVTEKTMIIKALCKLKEEFSIEPLFFDQIQDRESQITFSALGRSAPKELKDNYDADKSKRILWIEYLRNHISENYTMKIGGTTSIDICKGNWNKGIAIKKLFPNLDDVLYVGDSIFNGGNDSTIIGVVNYESVENPSDTKELIKKILKGEY